MNALTTIETERADRRLTPPRHHFSGKVEARRTPESGRVWFPSGRCEFAVDGNRLSMKASAENCPRLDRVMQIVSCHPERFAFRKNPNLAWRTSDD